MRSLVSRLLKLGLLAGLIYGIYRLYQEYAGTPGEERLGEMSLAPGSAAVDSYDVDLSKLGGTVSQDLLDILVCPLDKGPLELVDGKWLVNRRNGYRYPITDGIPVMLIEVGEKYKDESLISQTT